MGDDVISVETAEGLARIIAECGPDWTTDRVTRRRIYDLMEAALTDRVLAALAAEDLS